MSNDLKIIKERILEEDKVKTLLELMDCGFVEKRNNRYEAQLPDKFDSPNKRSVQVYLNSSLSSRIRTLGESDIDIYGLVSYIVFDKLSELERNKNLPKAKRWICQQLGFNEHLDQSYIVSPAYDHLKWLKDVKRQRKKKRSFDNIENTIYPEEIMEQYVMVPHQKYIEEGIPYDIQMEFQVGYDIRSQRIVYPVHNRYGDIVSVKGRTIFDNYEALDVYKFMYLYNFNKMVEFYNWHRALYYILEEKEVLIFEAEKTCWISSYFGYRNCLAISGDDLSDYQVNMIKELGPEINITIALDKDKTVSDVIKQAAKFGKTRNVFSLYDQESLFKDKDSPCDKGKEAFERLYSNNKFKVPV